MKLQVYLLLDNFIQEKKMFDRFVLANFGKISSNYTLDFYFHTLSVKQFVKIEVTLKDCIVSNRLDGLNYKQGWTFKVGYSLYVHKYCLLPLFHMIKTFRNLICH